MSPRAASYARELLNDGIVHLKAGELSLARKFFERATDSTDDDPTLAEAWFWFSQASEDPVEKRQMLENALSYDPNHIRSRRELAILDGRLKAADLVDPDRLPKVPQTPEPSRINARNFSCPGCGSPLAFAPDGQSLVCDHCGHKQPVNYAEPPQPAAEQDFIVAMSTEKGHRRPVLMHTFACRGCGADFMLPPEAISATCSYCGSTYVVDINQNHELLAPDGIIPLAFSQQEAIYRFVEWVRENRLEPREKVAPPRGLYLPVWTFDVGGEITYTGERLEGRETQVIQGSQSIFYNDIVVPASRKMGKLLGRMLPEFRFDQVVAYDPRYLVDWPAEVYQIAMGDASLEARSRVYQREKETLPEKLERGIHNLLTSSANMLVESYKHVLVPVWVALFATKGGADCTILINGQTGLAYGETVQSTGLPPDLKDRIDDFFKTQ